MVARLSAKELIVGSSLSFGLLRSRGVAAEIHARQYDQKASSGSVLPVLQGPNR